MIPSDLKATFIAINPLTADELLDKPNLKIIMIGGQISRSSQMSVGGEVYQRLSELRVDLCSMGTNAIDAKEGLTDSDRETVQPKKGRDSHNQQSGDLRENEQRYADEGLV